MQLKALGYQVVMLSIGPFPVGHVLSQLNFYDDEVVFDGHIIQRNEHKHWKTYRYEDSVVASFPLKIESEKDR